MARDQGPRTRAEGGPWLILSECRGKVRVVNRPGQCADNGGVSPSSCRARRAGAGMCDVNADGLGVKEPRSLVSSRFGKTPRRRP